MNKKSKFAAAIALAASTTFAQADTKTAVLVHGAFSDGSAWSEVIPILAENGLETIAVQLPMTSLSEDVKFTQRAINDAEGEIILVGHSWGGVVITEAGVSEKVSALVYLSAFAPEKGKHIHDILADAHGARGIAHVPGLANPIADSTGFLRLSEADILAYFAPDISEKKAKLIAATQGRVHASVLDHAPIAQAWDVKPTSYIVTSQDQMIAPDVQRLMANLIGAKVTEISASHASMISAPKEVAKVILEAAK